MTFLLVCYLLIGLLVYAVTDTSRMARRISGASFVVTSGTAAKYLFPFVVVLWPVWLVINAMTKE